VPAIAWSTIEDALHAWVRTASGLAADHVIWVDQGGPRPDGTYIAMRLASLRTIGDEWITTEDAPDPQPGAELLRKVRGHRVVTLGLQCFADATTASKVLADVIAGIALHAESLDIAGIGIGPISAMTRIDQGGAGGLLKSRAAVDVDLHLSSEVSDFVTFIERVHVTTTAKNPAGDEFVLETWIPNPPPP
jgi:hypothetical protein